MSIKRPLGVLFTNCTCSTGLQVVRTRSIFSHAGTVWGASLIPSWQAALIGQQQQPGCSGAGNAVAASPGPAAGQSSVLCTCAADGTVRLWNVCMDPSASTSGPTGMPQDPAAVARVTRTLRGKATQHALQSSAAAHRCCCSCCRHFVAALNPCA